MRSITEIYDEIIAAKEASIELQGLTPDPETSLQLLTDLTSASKVAIWRLWAYIISVAIWVHEKTWVIFKEEIEEIAAAAPAGQVRWYLKKVYEWQYGDELAYINNQYVYDPVAPDNRVVTRAAIEDRPDGVVFIKVAKGTTTIEALNNFEKLALEGYLKKIKFAGTRIVVLTQAADVLALNYNILYDPIYTLAQVQGWVQEALDGFRASLPFDGAIRVNAITDALQAAQGVVDPVFVSGTGTPLSATPVVITSIYRPVAGHVVYSGTAAVMFTFQPLPTP